MSVWKDIYCPHILHVIPSHRFMTLLTRINAIVSFGFYFLDLRISDDCLSSSFFFIWYLFFFDKVVLALPSYKHYLRCDCSISILIEKGKRFAEFRDLQRINSEKYFCKMIERFPATSSFCHNWTRTNSQNWFWKYFARFSWCKRNFHRNKNSSTLCFKILLIIKYVDKFKIL